LNETGQPLHNFNHYGLCDENVDFLNVVMFSMVERMPLGKNEKNIPKQIIQKSFTFAKNLNLIKN